MLTLYWSPQTRAARVVWMLEELGEPYQLRHVDIRNPNASRSDEFLQASPMGKVPALVDGEAKLSESAAICLYLADRYSNAKLAPAPDDSSRAPYLYWMFFVPSVMEPAFAEKFGQTTPNRQAHGWGDFDSMINVLRCGVAKGRWLLGERFTAADVLVGSTAYFLRTLDAMPADTAIDAYVDRCLERPAYQRAIQNDSDEVNRRDLGSS
jgi:glutathione S-transferase